MSQVSLVRPARFHTTLACLMCPRCPGHLSCTCTRGQCGQHERRCAGCDRRALACSDSDDYRDSVLYAFCVRGCIGLETSDTLGLIWDSWERRESTGERRRGHSRTAKCVISPCERTPAQGRTWAEERRTHRTLGLLCEPVIHKSCKTSNPLHSNVAPVCLADATQQFRPQG